MRSLQVAIVCCLLSVAACNLLDDLRELQLQTLYELREEGAEESEKADANGEGNLQITGSDGKVLNNVTFFEKEKLQVELPTDRKVCLIRVIETNATCFDEVAITAKFSDDIEKVCDGRQKIKLEEKECDESVNSDRGYELADRASASWCHRYTYTTSCNCYCCGSWWWWCTRRCCHRRVIWTRHSVWGYPYQFHVSA